MIKILVLPILFLGVTNILAQNHFLVELEKFSPPEKELIKTFKGFPAEPFLAKDNNGEEHFLGNYKGKNVLIWFWSIEDELSLSWLSVLNLVQLQYLDDIQIFGFCKEGRESLLDIAQNNAVIFPNFPKSTIFGDAVYGGDLGLGRMFFLDDFGIIKEVLPRSFFVGKMHNDLSPMIEKIIEQLIR